MRCADWAREQEVALGGTAGTCDGYLLVEWPTPWPRDAALVEELGVLDVALRAARVRLQLVRSLHDDEHEPRVILFRTDRADGFARYRRAEASAPSAELPAAALGLLALATDDLDDARGPSDLLVCSHGSRDACCGARGTALAQAAAHLAREHGVPVRVWRTTHLGGHRFAPTAVSLPDGMVWGRLDEPAIRSILVRDVDASSVLPYSRGCSGLEARAQLLDAALLGLHGWEWLATRRSARVDGDRVHIVVDGPDHVEEEWEGFVTAGRDLPVPACRTPLRGSEKREQELILAAYRAVRSGRVESFREGRAL